MGSHWILVAQGINEVEHGYGGWEGVMRLCRAGASGSSVTEWARQQHFSLCSLGVVKDAQSTRENTLWRE
jgi:hypothetical protein